jgi:SAM-dependent methyltransferase
VVGVEADPAVAERADASGVYERVLRVTANAIPRDETGYASAFANCSLEHMSDLDGVLAAIHGALAPGGRLLCSVVTDRFVSWQTLGPLIARSAGPASGEAARLAYMRHHHLENPLPAEQWIARLAAAGFVVEEHVPLLGEVTARAFLGLDEIWHLPGRGGGARELGHDVQDFLSRRPSFPSAFRHVLRGLLEMDAGDPGACGAVFVAAKPRRR